MKYYAHSKPGEPAEQWQPLEEHLANVAKMAVVFTKSIDAEEREEIAES